MKMQFNIFDTETRNIISGINNYAKHKITMLLSISMVGNGVLCQAQFLQVYVNFTRVFIDVIYQLG